MRLTTFARVWPLALLLALAACDEPYPDPGVSRCATPVPGCTDADCPSNPSDPAYGSCGGDLVTCNESTGAWEQIGFCEPAPLRLRGTWTISQTITAEDPCPAFTQITDHQLHATSVSDLTDIATGEPTPGLTEFTEDFHFGRARFELDDRWSLDGNGGTPIIAPIYYDLHFDWDYTITGTASTTFGYDTVDMGGTTCRYTYDVTGSFQPE